MTGALLQRVGVLLQTGAGIPRWIQQTIQATDVLAALLGLFIAYQAYRGYRRNRSRPMLFVSLGFVLALGVPVTLFLVALAVPTVPRGVLGLVGQAAELAGLACIVYALRMRPASRTA